MSLDYRLHKAQLDLEFLLRCRDSNVIPNVFEEVKETTLTFEKKRLLLVLPYLGSISLQTMNKLKKSSKNILNCCKLQIVFKNKTRLGSNVHFKDQIPKDLTSGIIYEFQCGLCKESYYGECVRHLNIRIGDHIGISPLTKK